MSNWKNMTAFALGGLICAAALAPAMAFTPPHNPINVGPTARVSVPNPSAGTARPGQPGPDHFDKVYTQQQQTMQKVVKAPTPPPAPASPSTNPNNNPDGIGFQ
jgi:hypothetical protein